MLNQFGDVRTKLFIEEGLLASVLASLDIIETQSVRIACTDGKKIFINPESWNKESFIKDFAILLHEMMHVVLEHPWIGTEIAKDRKDQFLLNCIGDIIINRSLKNQGYQLIDGALISFKQISESCADLDNIGINEQTILWFFEEVKKRLQGKDIGCGPQGGGKGRKSKRGQDGQDGEEGQGQGQPLPGGCYRPNNNEAERTEVAGAVKAALSSGLVGKIAGEIKTLLENFEKTKTDWKSILRRFLNVKFHKSWTYTPIGRMPRQYGFAGGSVVLPVLEKTQADKVHLSMIVDSSGSISDEVLYKFACEVFSLLKSFARSVRLIVCDADVQQDFLIDSVSKIPREFKGRGGTLFTSAFKAISKKPWGNVLIVLTDGEIGDLSELQKPKVLDVIWCVVNNDSFSPPFGRVVKMVYK